MGETLSDKLTRRQFLAWAAAVLPMAFFPACSVDPVTGEKELVLMGRDQEISIDKKQSPFQFSSDYGITQDGSLSQYVSEVGGRMLPSVHRLSMPYNFHCVNATYVNAYAFPGGSIAATRGILLKLSNEAELAALLGHELGHVNARHAAEQSTKGQLSSLVMGGLAVLAQTQGTGLGQLTQQLGSLGQGLFLSKYSRDNEREADALGHEYMTRAGYNSRGFVALMEMLNSLSKGKSDAVAMLFATHPMSRERLDMAVSRDQDRYKATHDLPLYKERFMDRTASLRRIAQAIDKMQEGEKYLGEDKPERAETAFLQAIKEAPEDYTAHVMAARCKLILKKNADAASLAEKATALYPQETQGHYIAGLAHLSLKKSHLAAKDFATCDSLLPGNPQVTFFRGYALDMDGEKREAAQKYLAYLNASGNASNTYTQHAYNRLKAWGYVN